MPESRALELGKRERQIVEAVFRFGEASVADVLEALPDPPTYSAVRAMLNLLVEKRVLTFRQEGKRYLYRPVIATVQYCARLVTPIQSGDVNLYLLYVFLVVLMAYLLGALGGR